MKVIIVALCAMLVALCFSAEAQQSAKTSRVGIIFQSSLSSAAANKKAFGEGLRDLGYVEGQNITIEYRYADGVDVRFQELANELVQLNVNVIVANGTPVTQAAKKATKTIPIVMVSVTDPVEQGLSRVLRIRVKTSRGYRISTQTWAEDSWNCSRKRFLTPLVWWSFGIRPTRATLSGWKR